MKIVTSIIFTVLWLSNTQAQPVQERISALADTVPDLRSQVDQLFLLSDEYGHSQPENRKYIGEKLLEIGQQLNDNFIQGRGHEVIGSAMAFSDFPVAIQNLLQAVSIFEELKNDEWLAKVYSDLSVVYQSMNEKENAITSINKAADYAYQAGDSSFISTVYTNKSSIYYHFKNIDSALYNGKIALAYKKALNQKRGTNLILLNLGLIMTEYDSLLDEGLSLILEAKDLALERDDGVMLSDVIANLIYVYYRYDDIKSCYAYIDSAVWAADSVDNDYTLQAVHRMAQEVYSEFGKMDKAYAHLLKEYEMEKELRGLQVQKKFEILELNYKNEKGLRQIAVLEKEKAQTQTRYTVAIMIALFTILVAALIYVVTKRNAKIRERELTLELEHKKRELASYAINFVQKNTLFGELKVRMTELQKIMGPESAKEIKQIKRLIEDNHRADKEWENFKLRFEEVHEDFFKNLTAKFPDLGNAEIKLCALLRLNLNLKESSHILGISPDSVKTARHRLRKKLGLNTEDNLVQFLTVHL
ncbi:hypothetical protein SAMN04488029_2081 [Reichenbachiella faecimaris]|uniref:Regulatory protein, luxR family n=1 Tax=Reichenbachiella faecimaris TaxID=692418 RepID=A0A1W2GD20_REIFA|nr:helix-turn-helix transcriptional regulator [Reichenbachiella faecimaris]SMD34569.1 hypothetical protein SAMN04488029_2081 [Reichenbachiella faecimaris]